MKLEHELITLNNNKQYFVLEDIMHDYDTYSLILNVEEEDDIKIVLQTLKNGKTVLEEVEDKELLKTLSSLFEERIRETQKSIN